MDWRERTELLLGAGGLKRLSEAHVCLFGLGGVGSFAGEALVRAGVGRLTVVDGDVVTESNLNRQLVALRSTLGRNKAEVFARRALDVNPGLQITAVPAFYTESSAELVDLASFDYVADCIDMVSAKLYIIGTCVRLGVPVVSSMGTANRLDPSTLAVRDLFATSGDPLARVMRKELRKRGVTALDVVCGAGEPISTGSGEPHQRLLGSVSWVPSVAGLLLAGHIVRRLAGVEP